MLPAGCGGVEETPAEIISFTLGSSAAFDTLNPLSSYMQVTYEFFMLVYDSLVKYDANYEAVPNLAKEWSVSDASLNLDLQAGGRCHLARWGTLYLRGCKIYL